MDDFIFSHNLINASVRYSKNFFAKQRKAGASVSDLMRYYDPDVRLPAINLKSFAEKYLDEQTRIADALDRFYAICEDIRLGLPAEINARQRQYEYYRDNLLTFENIS